MSASQAQAAFDLMSRVAPRLLDTRPLVPHALHLALAAQRGCSVLTACRRLFRAGAARHPSIRMLT
jgi:hypothetical protein